MKKLVKAIPVLLFASSLIAQPSGDAVLMTINNKPVVKSEFEYIYNKNNSNNSLDKKTLDEYVDLFINFKLKVEEACTQGLDTTKSFINELNGYRSQLTKPYLTLAKVDEDLLKEAYDRLTEDLEVSHILIRTSASATPEDTLAALNKIKEIRKRLEKEDFGKVAKEVSEDQSAVENMGKIGWITGFRTVYPFETMAYATPVGKISEPVRSSFGYHLIKVHNRRKSLGEIQVAHIMRFTSKGSDSINVKAKNSIDSIFNLVKNGADFGELATNLSEDRGSASKKGELPWFGIGRMIPEFENAAFKLNQIGDYSQPVESAYGWHIIKLLDKKGIPSFDAKKAELEKMIKRDERANKGQQAFIAQLKKEYGFKFYSENLKAFSKALDGKNLTDSTFQAAIADMKGNLASFAGKIVDARDFTNFLKKETRTNKSTASEIIDEKFQAFVEKSILDYEDSQLENKHEDFRLLMQEYHDGILLFEVSNNEVWEKASKDTEGLSKFFFANQTDYKWEKPHFKGRVIYCKDKNTLKQAKKILKSAPADSVDAQLRAQLNDSVQHIKIDKGLYVPGDNKFVDKFGFKQKIELENDSVYPYVIVDGKNLKYLPEDYSDVRGLVTADYQEFLEKEWIAALRNKYPVEVNKEVLKTVKSN